MVNIYCFFGLIFMMWVNLYSISLEYYNNSGLGLGLCLVAWHGHGAIPGAP